MIIAFFGAVVLGRVIFSAAVSSGEEANILRSPESLTLSLFVKTKIELALYAVKFGLYSSLLDDVAEDTLVLVFRANVKLLWETVM